jgi:hypothetical protein
MKNFLCHSTRSAACGLALAAAMGLIAAPTAHAFTSPYVTAQTDVPLNQATDDTVNGILPYFVSHDTVEGPVSRLTDAFSASAPGENVILGPDNTWVGVAWDFGDPPEGFIWRLDRFDAWIAGEDNLRRGYRADISVSVTGEIDDFAVVPNTMHWAGLTQNPQYNHIRYDFPTEYLAGATVSQDRYPVMGFRYLRFNSRGDGIEGVDWQTRFVEIDIWVTAIPIPTEGPAIHRLSWNPADNLLGFNWSAILGRTYEVGYKTDLDDPGWTPLQTTYARSAQLSFTDYTTADARRFYRVAVQP